jgi:hypothetical protein
MILFSLAIVFRLNETKEQSLFTLPSQTDTIIFFYRSSSPFCSHLLAPWNELEIHFHDSPELTLARVDCNESPSACAAQLSTGHEVPVFQQRSSFLTAIVPLGPDFPSMLRYTNALLALKNMPGCQRFNGTYPAVVLHGTRESVCSTIGHLAFHLPDQVHNMYWLDSDQFHLEVFSRENRTVEFQGPRKPHSYAEFIREYTLPQWGTWDPLQVPVQRKLAFLVFSQNSETELFHGTFPELYDRVLFGFMHVELFRDRYPSVSFHDRDLPLVCVVGHRRRFLVLRRAAPFRERFRYLLKMAVSDRTQSSMRYLFRPPQIRLFRRDPSKRVIVCGLMAISSVISTVGLIFRHSRSCLRPYRRSPVLPSCLAPVP